MGPICAHCGCLIKLLHYTNPQEARGLDHFGGSILILHILSFMGMQHVTHDSGIIYSVYIIQDKC